MKRADVIVIGAGPSGLRAAGRLAAAGLDVRVLEKKSRVGANVVCTGIVGKEVFDDFGLDLRPVIEELRTVRLVSPFSTVLTYEHPRPFACVVDREKFDSALAATAVSAGAAVVCDARVDDISISRGGAEVTVRDGQGGVSRQAAAVVVLATGVDFGLQKKIGLATPRDFLRGAQVEASLPGRGTTTLFFGRDVAPGAFAWSVPAGEGKARVGLLTKKDPRARLRKLLDAHFDGCPGTGEEVQIRTKPVAQGLLSGTFGDRVLAVGEAAGQTKTTTGGGISYGLTCADLAADVILECFGRSSFGAADLAEYERRWKGLLQKEIVVGHYTRRMCARLSDGRIESLFHLAQTDGIVPIIREKADFDWHSGLILALLQRLSFMKIFRDVKDRLGPFSLS
ncbi:MAG: NAD(P)/FAD-dependent oxidoreductase [Candidatus Aminicenantes bacterium]|nr:NAD(P)/FAD-dependent oxidoreductase [Candidatus Aminicenantes bacterium]